MLTHTHGARGHSGSHAHKHMRRPSDSVRHTGGIPRHPRPCLLCHHGLPRPSQGLDQPRAACRVSATRLTLLIAIPALQRSCSAGYEDAALASIWSPSAHTSQHRLHYRHAAGRKQHGFHLLVLALLRQRPVCGADLPKLDRWAQLN
eukprot:1856983-Pleurochrysis_carterae.AAC.1